MVSLTRVPKGLGKLTVLLLAALMLQVDAPAQTSLLAPASESGKVNEPATLRAMGATWSEVILSDPRQAERRELIVSHGIAPQNGELIRFLREGFPAGAKLPAEPRMKTFVVNAVIEELGLTAESGAVDALIEIVARTGPAAVSALILRDFEDSPMDAVEPQVQLTRRALALNAIVALGLIGDPKAEDAILAAMEGNPSGFVTRGAESLALMGSSRGLEPLIRLAENVTSDDSVAAFDVLWVITGRNYGYTQNTALARRRELAIQLRSWFSLEGSNAPILRSEVLRRLEIGPPPRVALDPESLRGLLRASMDVSNYDARLNARDRLEELAPTQEAELRLIGEDSLEDLDIRRAALRLHAFAHPNKAKRVLRRALKDENDLISGTAKTVMEDLPEYQARAKAEGRQ